MPLLPSALPPKGEARRYVTNDFLNLTALPIGEGALLCGASYYDAPLRNLEPVNLNPEPVAPATRLERKEAHLLLFRQSFEDAHGV